MRRDIKKAKNKRRHCEIQYTQQNTVYNMTNNTINRPTQTHNQERIKADEQCKQCLL